MSQLFVCKRCQFVDLQDLAESEVLRINAEHALMSPGGTNTRQFTFEPLVCTSCLTGQWHGQFEHRHYCAVRDKDAINMPFAF